MTVPTAILMGSKPGSLAALSIMLERGWEIPFVVVCKEHQYPWIQAPSLEEYARNKGLNTIAQEQLPDDVGVDFVISYMYRHRVKPKVLSLAKRAAVNFHAGPLPGFGGWAFYNVAILEDVPEYGCSCHYMDEGFDSGPVLKVRRFPIKASQETAVSLEQRSQLEMIRLFREFCAMAESGEDLPRQEQDPEKVRYMSRQEFEALKHIPEDADEETIQRYARAFWYPPYECGYVEKNGVRVEVVPKGVKDEIAMHLHNADLEMLMDAAGVDWSRQEQINDHGGW